ncbi:MAG: hypothetical protein GX421_06385 [Caldisericales bacterium]|nr:hypothetical protein [Caldisericales bacterium]
MKRNLALVLLSTIVFVSCGAPSYLEGPDEARNEIGKIIPVPDGAKLVEMGEEMQKNIASFNYLFDIEDKINILDGKQREYSVAQSAETGEPEILNDNSKKDGTVEILYSAGSIAKINLATGKITSFQLSELYRPPKATQNEMQSERAINKTIAEKVARAFFKHTGKDVQKYAVSSFNLSMDGQSRIVLSEVLEDRGVSSPNRLVLDIDFWGFVVGFDDGVGPDVTIGTRPAISEDDAVKTAKAYLGIKKGREFINAPRRVVYRKDSVENGKLYVLDRLVWFFDLIPEKLEGRAALIIDAITPNKVIGEQ